MAANERRQVGVLRCPPEQIQGRKSVAFYGGPCRDIAHTCCDCCCGSFCESSNNYSCSTTTSSNSSSISSPYRSIVKPIEPTEVTINSYPNRSSSSHSTSCQTPPVDYESVWSFVPRMGWISAKSLQAPRIRVRRTSHRKLRRCKRRPTSGQSLGVKDLDVNYKYATTSKRSYIQMEDHQNSSLHKPKSNLITTKHNPRASSDRSHAMDLIKGAQCEPNTIKLNREFRIHHRRNAKRCPTSVFVYITLVTLCFLNEFQSPGGLNEFSGSLNNGFPRIFSVLKAEASLIIGDSAIEIQEVDMTDGNANQNSNNVNQNNNLDHLTNGAMQTSNEQPNELIFGSTGGIVGSVENQISQASSMQNRDMSRRPGSMPGPLPPLVSSSVAKGIEDITDGDKKSRDGHDYDVRELNLNDRQAEKDALKEVFSVKPEQTADDKAIAGKVVDFELTPAGGHNKAKIKKKKKQKKEEEMFKKWGKKKKSEKKAMEQKHKEMMKKKKEEGQKGKKKWGKEEHGLKKKGKFKKQKWGKKVKKGKGVKKGKKGKKFLKDVGHKNTGFKTVYHKEEWGKSSKWHDIKRQKKWDEKSKKWKKKWKKEKGKKYKGDHMKKFEKKKKSGKKYKKESKNKFKKFKKEEFEKGKKKKLEEKSKKKEGGAKKMMKEAKKKKKKY